MSNTSATGGYLLPSSTPAPLEGQSLLRFLQQVIAAITGLDGTLVRPRWQPEPPNIPTAGTAWAAVGITSRSSDTYPYVGMNADGLSSTLQRHEQLDLLCSFYDLGSGGEADNYAALLRDGMAIAQNREALAAGSFKLIEVGDLLAVPSLLKDRWLYRVDLPLSLRRVVQRTYAVESILSGDITLDAEGSALLIDHITVSP